MNKKTELQPAQKTAIQAPTPSALLQIAIDQGADLDRLEKLMDLQTRWEDNEARKAFTLAMTAFRSTCPPIKKDKKGHNSNYASLAHSLSVIKDHLSKHGLSHSWKTAQSDNGLISVTCCVTHELGYQECTTLSASADTTGSKNAIQAMGSTISYLERYTLYAILGLASSELDDDGDSAREQPKPKPVLTPENKNAWAKAIQSYQCYGNFDAITPHMDISDDNRKLIIEASNVS